MFFFLLFKLNIHAQNSNSVTIYLEKAGGLSAHISEDEKYKITDLTIVGYLNRADFEFLKDMAGNTWQGLDLTSNHASQYKTDGKLSVLNLYDTKINNPQDMYFAHCLSLTSIILPKELHSIKMFAFAYCENLKEIAMDNVSTIEAGVFCGCKSLTDPAILPENILKIEGSTFEDCTGFTQMIIPYRVNSIGQAFLGCANIKEFIVAPQNNDYIAVDGILLSKDKKKLIAYPPAKSKYYIPEGVVELETRSFWECMGLTSIEIPESVKKIKWGTFENCKNLKTIYINNPIPPYCDERAFDGVSKANCTLYIPKGSYNAYWFEEGWRGFNIIETDFATSNENISFNPVKLFSSNGNIIIETEQELPIRIFSIDGKLIFKSNVNGYQNISVNKGVYIVEIDKKTTKLIVK